MASKNSGVDFGDTTKLVQVARQIAINHKDIESILDDYSITPQQWEKLQSSPDFIRVLETEIVAWQSAQNTHERTRLKAAALIEEWLLEANTRLYDKDETLPAKTELAKLIARIAEMGVNNANVAAGGERFTVTINLGASNELKFEKELPPKVIEAQPTES